MVAVLVPYCSPVRDEMPWIDAMSVRRAEKPLCRGRTRWFRHLNRPVPAARRAAEVAQGGKSLSNSWFQEVLMSAATPPGGMSVFLRNVRCLGFAIGGGSFWFVNLLE